MPLLATPIANSLAGVVGRWQASAWDNRRKVEAMRRIGKAAALSAGCALVISVLSAMGPALPASAAGITLYVGGSSFFPGNDSSNGCQDQFRPCATISHAVTQAASGDTIEYDTDGTLGPMHDQVTIPSGMTGLTITGNDPGLDVVDGINGAGAPFVVQLGASVTIQNITIENAELGVQNYGVATFIDDVISGNNVGLVNIGFDPQFQNGPNTLTLIDNTISNNGIGAPDGGGVEAGLNGTVTSTGNTYYHNYAEIDNGGAGSGGAIRNYGNYESTNDTLVANTAEVSGGAVDEENGTMSLSHDTFALNTLAPASTGDGEDINSGGDFITQVGGSILSGDGTHHDCSGGVLSDNFFNLDDDNSCVMDLPIVPTFDLMPLGNYGGPTQTMPPAFGSPALNRILTGNQGCPGTDQRGLARPTAGQSNCDIGAVESAFPSIPSAKYHTPANTTLIELGLAQGLLGGLSDANGECCTFINIVTAPSHGSLTLQADHSLGTPDGSFSYAPDAGYAGPDPFTYTVTDDLGFVSAPITVTVYVGVKIPPSLIVPAVIGAPYTVQLSAEGGVLPYHWKKLTKLPKGLKLSSSGLLSGTPKPHDTPGSYNIEVLVKDSSPKVHLTATNTLTLQLVAP